MAAAVAETTWTLGGDFARLPPQSCLARIPSLEVECPDVKALLSAILAAGILSAGGCAQLDLRGEGFDPDRFPEYPVRADDDSGPKRERWGFSTKAQEIEDRLGVN